MNAVNIYFNFNGRLSLNQFWIYWNIPLLIIIGIVTIIEKQGYILPPEFGKIATILIIWPFLATSAKRTHDINKSAWWLLLHMIPGLGLLLYFAISLIPGKTEPNEYDQDVLREKCKLTMRSSTTRKHALR